MFRPTFGTLRCLSECPRRRRTRQTALLVVTLVLGCRSVHERVIPSGTGVAVEPKPQDCGLPIYRTKLDEPYDEIAAVQVEGANGLLLASPEDLQERIRAKACALGADAVLITHDYTVSYDGKASSMTGVAVRYRRGTDKPPLR